MKISLETKDEAIPQTSAIVEYHKQKMIKLYFKVTLEGFRNIRSRHFTSFDTEEYKNTLAQKH